MQQLTESEKRFRVYLVVFAFALFTVVLFGFIYLATTPAETLTMLLSFSGGISNIVLPCTLPFGLFVPVPRQRVSETPLQVLQRRYAAGEISTQEYNEMHRRPSPMRFFGAGS